MKNLILDWNYAEKKRPKPPLSNWLGLTIINGQASNWDNYEKCL